VPRLFALILAAASTVAPAYSYAPARKGIEVPVRIDLCALPAAPKTLIGHLVAVRGRLELGTESMAVVDDRCPNMLLLEAEHSIVSLRVCSGGNDPQTSCGGLHSIGQSATFVGILRRAAVWTSSGLGKKEGEGNAYIDIVRIENVDPK
jgi:hypothetical protein